MKKCYIGKNEFEYENVDELRQEALKYGIIIEEDVEFGNLVVFNGWAKIGRYSKIGDYVRIGHETEIGHTVTVGRGTRIGNEVKIDDCVVLGMRCNIGNRSSIGKNCRFSSYVRIRKCVDIGSNVELQYKVILNNNVTLEDNTSLFYINKGHTHIAHSVPDVFDFKIRLASETLTPDEWYKTFWDFKLDAHERSEWLKTINAILTHYGYEKIKPIEK